jgi:hypothetical protein
MPEISKPGKSVYVRMGVWWDPDQGHIHLTAPGVEGFHTTLNNTPGSKRCHEKPVHEAREASTGRRRSASHNQGREQC